MSYNTQDIAQIGKKFSGPTCQFNSPEAEKLLLIYLVINHLKVTQHFFGRQAYGRTSNTGVRIHHFGSSGLHNNPNWLNDAPWCHLDTSPTLHGVFTELLDQYGQQVGICSP